MAVLSLKRSPCANTSTPYSKPDSNRTNEKDHIISQLKYSQNSFSFISLQYFYLQQEETVII